MKKGWADYILEALGLGLAFGAVGLALGNWFGDTVQAGIVSGLVGLFLGSGLRLAAGRSSATKELADTIERREQRRKDEQP